MTINKENTGVNVGIDVGKFQLDIHIWERDRHFTVENDEAGIREALKILKRYRIERITMEATGRYEMAFASLAFEMGMPVAIVRPILVRQFAKAADQLAKTDKIDAKIIARILRGNATEADCTKKQESSVNQGLSDTPKTADQYENAGK